MELVEKYRWLIIAVAVVLIGGLFVWGNNSSDKASDNTTKSQDKAAAEAKKKEEVAKKKAAEKQNASTGVVTYTARSGDSYTVLARKAVQAYAAASQTEVSQAQVVAAETFLTVDAGSPFLNFGQKVTLDKGVVSKAVKKAQALSAAEIAAWQTYVPYVNFDTSNNG